MRILFFIFFYLIYLTSWSQTVTYDTIVEINEVDEGVFDTIYYVKKHVQFNEEFVVVDTVRGNQWAIDAFGGANLIASKPRYNASNLTFNSHEGEGYYFGGSLYYNFSKKWSLRVGAKLDYQKITAYYTKATNYTIDVFDEVNDTLDTYHTISGTDTNYFHIIEPMIVQSTQENTDYSDVIYHWEVYFLKVPIQLTYALELNRWNFSVLAGTSLNFQLKRSNGNMLEDQGNVVSIYSSGIASIQVGYFIGNSTIIHIEPLFEKSFTSVHNSIIPANQFSLSLGLKQFF